MYYRFCRWKRCTTIFPYTTRVLRDDEYFTDVTLATEGHSVKAHRVILSACSNYFHAILKTMRPWQHPVLVLQDVKSADLNSLMDFIYFGQVGNLKRIILFERAERLKVPRTHFSDILLLPTVGRRRRKQAEYQKDMLTQPFDPSTVNFNLFYDSMSFSECTLSLLRGS